MPIQYVASELNPNEATIHGDVVYLGMQVAATFAPTIAEQTRQILDQIDASLARCGTSKRKLLSATVYCSDARHFDEANTQWDAWVPWHDPPGCSYIVARLAVPERYVAIQITAGI